jgi:RimJ/RimL family protein N-acetyltransferase
MPSSELSTARLHLRRFREADIPALGSLYALPEVVRYIGDGTPGDERRAREHISEFDDSWAKLGYGLLGVWHQSGAFVGRAGLMRWTLEWDWEVEINLLLLPAWQRHGYGLELGRALLADGRDVATHGYYIGLVHPENQASKAFARRFGAVPWRETLLRGNRICVYRKDLEQR